MGSSPIFNEVIGVQFDTESFAASIRQLQELWSKALEDMSGASPNVGVSNMGEVTDALKKTAEQIKGLGEQYSTTLEGITGKLAESVSGQATKVEEKVAAVKSAASKALRDVVDELADVQNKSDLTLANFNQASKRYLAAGLDPGQLTTNAQGQIYDAVQKSPNSLIDTDYDALTARQKQWFTNFSQVMAQAEDRLRSFGSNNDSEAFTRFLVEASSRANSEMLADFRTKMEERVQIDALTEEELSRLNEQELEVYIDVLSRKQLEQEKATEARIALLKKEEQAEVRAYEAGLSAFRQYVRERIAAEEEDVAFVASLSAERSKIYDEEARRYAATRAAAYAEDTRRAGAPAKAEDDAAIQRRMQQQVAMQETANNQMLADFRKAIAAKIAAGQLDLEATKRLTAQESEIYDQEARKFAATWEAAYAEKNKREKVNASGSGGGGGSKEPSGLIDSFGAAFSKGISPETVGQLAGMQLAWTGIGAAIGLASKAVGEVVDQFKSGFEYLAQLEQKAALLQGVIASNVTLSKDFATNFKLSGQAAVEVQRHIEDASIQYGIAVDVLDRGFKQFVDGGGVSLVRNLDEAQKVTVLFGAALQAAGKDADQSRAILSELPKILSGTEKPSSFILETLGLTAKEFDKMVAHAKTHKDLLDELTPRMNAYKLVAEEAANRQLSLTAAIGLEMKRLMADSERSAFGNWTEALQQIRKFLEDNRVVIKAMVETLVTFGGELVKLVGSLGYVLSSLGVWKAIGAAIMLAAEALGIMADGFATIFNIVSKFFSILTDPSKWTNFKNSIKEAMDYAKEQVDGFGDKLDGAVKRLVKAGTGKEPAKATATSSFAEYLRGNRTNIVTDPLLDAADGKKTQDLSKPKTNNDPLRDLQRETNEKEAASKAIYELEVQNNEKLLALRTKSIEETDAANRLAAEAEYNRQLAIVTAASSAASGLKGVKPDAIKGFQENLVTKGDNLKAAENKRLHDAEIKDIKDKRDAEDKADAASIASRIKLTDDEIALYKKAEAAGTITARQSLDNRIIVTESEKNAVDKQYDHAVLLAGKDKALAEKLTADKAKFDEAYTAKAEAYALERTNISIKEYDSQQSDLLKAAKAKEEAVLASTGKVNRTAGGGRDLQARVEATKAILEYAKAEVIAAQRELDFATRIGQTDEALGKKAKALQDAQSKAATANSNLDAAKQAQIDKSPEGSALINLGTSLKDTFESFHDSGKDFTSNFTDSVKNLSEAVNVFHDAANNILNGIKNGGALGGAGAAASSAGDAMTSLAGSVGKALGPIFSAGGPIMSAVGGLFSAASAIFQQEAQDIADAIQKKLTLANNAYQDQTATLIQTLQAVQQQRQDAINQLSGVKGGQAQLDKLLPQIDQEIAQLQLQIKQAVQNFTNSLHDLQLNNTALSEAFDKWQQINKQVQDYLSAGGDVRKANQFISDSLAAMKKAAGDSLNQGYQTAISDALTLNGLIQQRMQMETQEAQTEFGLINGDALERRGVKAIGSGTQLQQQKAQFQQQLEALNSQISLTQEKVALEGKMFDLAMSTDQLRQESNLLQIAQLQEQLKILQAQKDIYNGITQGADGKYTASTTLMNEIGIVNINVTAGGTPGDTSAAQANSVADTVAQVVNTWSRTGLGTYIGKT